MTGIEYLKSHNIAIDFAQKQGVVEANGWLVFPIKNGNGDILYHKYRNLTGNEPKFKNEEGSQVVLYNSEIFYQEKKPSIVVICEGEPDCLKLTQEGIPAVTSTGGALTFKEDWVYLFEDYQVVLCLDNDEAGKKGKAKLMEYFPSAWEIILPEGTKDVCDFFTLNTKTEFGGLLKDAKERAEVDYEKLCVVVDKWLLLPDKNVLRVVVATLIAHHFSTDPLWLFLVAPPSGTKTEIINSISALPFVYQLSDLTANTLASGMPNKNGKDPSLLPKLTNNVLALKDFTTVLNMRNDDRQIILSQLREIYDGYYSKSFGTGKTVDWKGRIGLIAGVTTMIDQYTAIFQVMGERFLMYRVPQPNDKMVAKKALSNYGQEKQMRLELKNAMTKYFAGIKIPPVAEIELPEEISDALASLASFIVICRSGVIRDYRKEIEYIPAPEAPSRFAKQLGTLIKALAVTDGRKTCTWLDYFLTMRTAFDVISQNRMSHLLALCNRATTAKTLDVATATGYSRSGTEMILEDFVALKLVETDLVGQGVTKGWWFSDTALDYMRDLLPPNTDGWQQFFPENDKYYPLMLQLKASDAQLIKTNYENLPETPIDPFPSDV